MNKNYQKLFDQAKQLEPNSAADKALLQMLNIFTEYLINDRQASGIANATLQGRLGGAPANIERNREIVHLLGKGFGPTKISKQLGCCRDTVYRIKNKIA